MKHKRELNFFLLIIMIITGSKVFQHFDFQNMKFEKPWLDAIYLITFITTAVYLVITYFKKSENWISQLNTGLCSTKIQITSIRSF